MSKSSFNVSIDPAEAFRIVKNGEAADLIHEELNEVGDHKYIGILVFEKYFMRAGNRAGLIVIFDNTKGRTEIRVIATASSQGMIFNFDWGAGDDFANSVQRILDAYII